MTVDREAVSVSVPIPLLLIEAAATEPAAATARKDG